MAVQIYFPDYAAFSEEVALDGNVFVLGLRWNTREKCWSMSISNREGNLIVSGIKLVVNFNVVAQYQSRSIPQGLMAIVDTAMETMTDRIARRDMYENRKLAFIFTPQSELS